MSPQPKVLYRARYDDWMAVSPKGYRFKIGVMGPTSEQAEANWHQADEKWNELANRGTPHDRP